MIGLAAAAQGAVAGGPVAAHGVISGRIELPGRAAAPALIVVARGLDGQGDHLVRVAESTTGYRVEVPAGRYIVFAVPQDAADPRRGAYTGFSQCARIIRQGGRAIRPCTTSPPLTVEIAPGAERRDVDLDDWALKDEVAATLQLAPPAPGR